jgi:DNA repair protein RadD
MIESFPDGFVPRKHQIEAADAIFAAWKRGVRRPAVDMCVGSGKSYTMGIVSRRTWGMGQRSVTLADRRELVEQNAKAFRKLGLECGINAAALNERTWRGPSISASIHSVHRNTMQLGNLGLINTDEAHMVPHGQAGMYRSFLRAFPNARQALYTGTPFRLNGGRLDEGPDAPSDEIVYTYSIIDGINDGYLVPAFTAEALGKIDPNLLKKTSGEFTASSQDAQTIELIESHIAQLKIIGANRRSWLIFEASVKSAELMTEALNRHGISARCITEKTPDTQRTLWIEAFKTGAIRALVNVAALTTGFDAQICDMLVMRRRTASLGLYVQMIGRLLRTIGGHISLSIAAGKADGVVVDFAGNVDQHGPLDFLRPKESTVRMVDCMSCKKANVSAAVRCWNCNEKMTRVCPGCNEDIEKGLKQCPLCEAVLDNRNADGSVDEAKPRNANLLEMPSGAALIQAFRPIAAKEGGWVPIRKAFKIDDMPTILDANGDSWALTTQMEGHMSTARWVRGGENGVAAFLLKPNGMSRSNAMMVTPAGVAMPVPMPPTLSGVQEA